MQSCRRIHYGPEHSIQLHQFPPCVWYCCCCLYSHTATGDHFKITSKQSNTNIICNDYDMELNCNLIHFIRLKWKSLLLITSDNLDFFLAFSLYAFYFPLHSKCCRACFQAHRVHSEHLRCRSTNGIANWNEKWCNAICWCWALGSLSFSILYSDSGPCCRLAAVRSFHIPFMNLTTHNMYAYELRISWCCSVSFHSHHSCSVTNVI